MRLSASIILLFVVSFSGYFVASSFAQSASGQAPSPLVWQGIDIATTLQMWANVAVILGVPAAAILAFLALRQLRETCVARYTEITLRLYEHYQSDHIRNAMDYIRKPELRSPENMLDPKKIDDDRSAEKYFIDLANFFEIIAGLVKSKQWDPVVAERLFGKMLKYYWTECKPVVRHYREKLDYPGAWKPWEEYVENM